MNVTPDPDEAFTALGVVPEGAPGPFTVAMGLDAIENGLKREYAANLDPDYDTMPIVFFVGVGGMTAWPVGSYVNSDAGKDQMVNILRGITAKYHSIHAVIFVTPGWCTRHKIGEEIGAVPPSQSPDRREVVIVNIESRDGTQDGVRMYDLMRLDTGNYLVLDHDYDNDAGKSAGGRISNFFNRKE